MAKRKRRSRYARQLLVAPARENPGVSTGMTIAIVAGSAAVVGGIIYVATRPATATPAAAATLPSAHFAGNSVPPVATSPVAISASALQNLRNIAVTESTTLASSTASSPQVLQIAAGGTEVLSLPPYASWNSLSVTSGGSTNQISVSGQGTYSFTYAGGGGSVSATWTQFGGQAESSYLTFAN